MGKSRTWVVDLEDDETEIPLPPRKVTKNVTERPVRLREGDLHARGTVWGIWGVSALVLDAAGVLHWVSAT